MKVFCGSFADTLYNGDAKSVSLPTVEGRLTILSNHEPMITTLAPGNIKVSSHEGETSFPVTSGVVEFSNNRLNILL